MATAPSVVIKGNGNSNVYTTNGVQKNGPWTTQEIAELLLCGAAVWNDATGAPYVLQQTTVNKLDTT